MSDTSASLKGKILSGDRALSQGQLLANVARAATGLSALGIGAEDTVAIMIRNDFPFFEASMAARAVGARSVPINWHYQAEEAGYILRDSRRRRWSYMPTFYRRCAPPFRRACRPSSCQRHWRFRPRMVSRRNRAHRHRISLSGMRG